jgi:hypothetical protein
LIVGILEGVRDVHVDTINPWRFARNRENENFGFPGLKGEIIGIGRGSVRFVFVKIGTKRNGGKVTEERPAATIGTSDDCG